MAAQALTIFLLKEEYDKTNCLEPGHELSAAIAKHLPRNSHLVLYNGAPNQPSWCRYLGVSSKYSRSSLSGILFICVSGRTFAMTFGHAYHQLAEEAYEHDFGLLVTLNGVDPNKLRAADSAQPGAGRIKRTQGNQHSDLTLLDFRFHEEVLKSLSGAMRDDFKPWFDSATGSANLKIRSKVPAQRLDELCAELLKLYNCETYKDTFKGAQTLSRVRDPAVTNLLDAKLIAELQKPDPAVFLVIPDLIDIGGGMTVYFGGAGKSAAHSDVFLAPYLAYLASNKFEVSALSTEVLQKKHRVHIYNGESQLVSKFSVYRSLTFDTKLDSSGETYHLLDRTWYKAAKDFVARLNADLDSHWVANSFPVFAHATEGDYNKILAAASAKRVCLDKTDVAPKKSTMVEPCDVLEFDNDAVTLVHVKLSTFSNKLSHLFSQGMNSVELLRHDAAALINLKRLVNRKAKLEHVNAMLNAIDGRRFNVLFAIVTHKDEANKSRNLPLFSRIGLRRSINALKAMDATAKFCFVKNTLAKSKSKLLATPKPAGKAI